MRKSRKFSKRRQGSRKSRKSRKSRRSVDRKLKFQLDSSSTILPWISDEKLRERNAAFEDFLSKIPHNRLYEIFDPYTSSISSALYKSFRYLEPSLHLRNEEYFGPQTCIAGGTGDRLYRLKRDDWATRNWSSDLNTCLQIKNRSDCNKQNALGKPFSSEFFGGPCIWFKDRCEKSEMLAKELFEGKLSLLAVRNIIESTAYKNRKAEKKLKNLRERLTSIRQPPELNPIPRENLVRAYDNISMDLVAGEKKEKALRENYNKLKKLLREYDRRLRLQYWSHDYTDKKYRQMAKNKVFKSYMEELLPDIHKKELSHFIPTIRSQLSVNID